MLLSSAAGLDWCGFKTKRCRGLYIGLEGSLRDWGRRQQAWASLHGVTDEPDIPFISAGFNIMSKNSRDELYRDHLEGRNVGLIGIDTLGQAMLGFDPNAPKDMIQLVGGGLDLSQRSGATVIFVHHPTKTGDTFSGAYAQLGNAGFNIEVALVADLPGKEKIIKLVNHKQQEGEVFAPFALRLVPVSLETPFGPTSTLAVKERELIDISKADEPPATRTAIDDALLAAFKVLDGGGEWPRGKIAEQIRANPGTGGVGNTVLNLALDEGVKRFIFEREKIGREVVYWRAGKRGVKAQDGAMAV